jgi:hypothetical protein
MKLRPLVKQLQERLRDFTAWNVVKSETRDICLQLRDADPPLYIRAFDYNKDDPGVYVTIGVDDPNQPTQTLTLQQAEVKALHKAVVPWLNRASEERRSARIAQEAKLEAAAESALRTSGPKLRKH